MRLFAQLKSQVSFWVLVSALLFLTAAFLFTSLVFHNWVVDWEDLPPLPHGETAKSFTDVLARNRINVLTDQGHYYSCRYEAAETCWVAIPREVNTPKSNNPGIGLPILPRGTRQMVVTRGAYDDGFIALIAIIRQNGQVAFWDGRYNAIYWAVHAASDMCCGILFLMVGVPFVMYILETRAGLIRSQTDQEG